VPQSSPPPHAYPNPLTNPTLVPLSPRPHPQVLVDAALLQVRPKRFLQRHRELVVRRTWGVERGCRCSEGSDEGL
jgi:hypothetical protein